MSVLFIDGFDHYGNKRHPGSLRKWDFTIPSSRVIVSAIPPVRNGTHSMKIPTGDIISTNRYPPSDGALVGFAVYFPILPTTGIDLVQILNESVRLVSLRVDPASRKFQIRGKDDGVLANGITVIGVGVWYYLEFRVGFGSGNNHVRFRVNGVTEINTSANTDANGPVWNRISLGGVVPDQAYTVFDDFYLSNLSGPAPYNNFLGTIRVETLFPEPGSGNHADFEVYPAGETDHGKQVNETSPNTFDYNIAPAHLITGGSETALEETYHYPNIEPLRTNIDPFPPKLPILERIVGVQPTLFLQRDSQSIMHFRSIINTGRDHVGPDSEVEEFWKYFTQMFEMNPEGPVPTVPAEWTEAAVNAMMVGLQVFHVEEP